MIFPDFPEPSERKKIDSIWIELMLGIEKNADFRSIVELMWQELSNYLINEFNISINGPNEKPWFHLRRRMHSENPETDAKKYAPGRIEILRIKNEIIDKDKLEKIRLLSSSIDKVICAGWWHIQFTEHQDDAFLSFLQKLCEIRIKYGRIHKRWINDTMALSMMMDKGLKWNIELAPWLKYMKKERESEYAHWYAHILSGW